MGFLVHCKMQMSLKRDLTSYKFTLSRSTANGSFCGDGLAANPFNCWASPGGRGSTFTRVIAGTLTWVPFLFFFVLVCNKTQVT